MDKPSPAKVVFEGDSRDVIRASPKDIREDFEGELQRVRGGERPLDSRSMAPAIPGAFELRDEDAHSWYRVIYWTKGGVVYVLHCFKKTTNQTSQGDIDLANKGLGNLKAKLAQQKKASKR